MHVSNPTVPDVVTLDSNHLKEDRVQYPRVVSKSLLCPLQRTSGLVSVCQFYRKPLINRKINTVFNRERGPKGVD